MKKTIRNIIAATCAVALSGCMLAGCSSQSSTSTTSSTETTAASAVEQTTVYVSADWVKSALDGQESGYENVLVAEVVYDESGLADSYDKGHVPGATYVTDVDVEDAEGTVEAPYNLLAASEVEANLLNRGITKDTKVVLYGADAAGVGRVAWGMLWAGVEDVKILDGGLDAWTAASYETETTKNEATAATDFGTTVPAHPEYCLSMEDAKSKLTSDSNFKLVSIRSTEEFAGTTSGYSYIDRAGEPDGAVYGGGCDTAFDVNGYLNEDGTVISLDDLKAMWADADFDIDSNELSFYCGTGWRATVPFLLLYQNGYTNISVYDGGWYQWQQHDENPVQVGDPASGDVQHVTVADLPTDKAAK